MSRRSQPIAPRLLSRVFEFGEDCWEWTGSLDGRGYGQLSIRGRPVKAYVVSYQIHIGPTTGKYVLHRCDNRSCVNPSHLFLGTHQDNLTDMRLKNRQSKGSMFPQAKITETDVPRIRQSNETNKTLAQLYGVNPSVISRIRSGKVWRHVT